MEVRFDPRLQNLPRIQKKKEGQGQGNAFEEALQGDLEQDSDQVGKSDIAAQTAAKNRKAPKTRNGDGKGLKVDLLA